jgi:putative ABC transport system permease protein
VLRQGLQLLVLGVSIGLLLAFATSRVLTSLLYEIEPTDPLTYLSITIALTVVALCACVAPARRAAAVDPMTSLRG